MIAKARVQHLPRTGFRDHEEKPGTLRCGQWRVCVGFGMCLRPAGGVRSNCARFSGVWGQPVLDRVDGVRDCARRPHKLVSARTRWMSARAQALGSGDAVP